jgi:Xaa-Pro aminopeptidase
MTETKHEAKLGRLREVLQHDVDAVLVLDPTNIFYLTGFRGLEAQDREAYALVRPDAGAACDDPVAVT